MRLVVLFLTAFYMLALPASPARAAINESRQYLDYNIYIGGLKTFSANLAIIEQEEAGDYQLVMDARTEGLLNIFTTWEGTMETKGRYLESGQTAPIFHRSVSVWPDNTQIKRFAWTENGTLKDLYISEEGKTKNLEDINRQMARNSVDIMTASLSIMQTVSRTGKCEGEARVFDGKRRFRLKAINQGYEILKPSRYNKYAGEALRCEITVIPENGDWHEKLRGWMAIQEQGRQAGAKPTVWLAKLDSDSPPLPVKLTAKTKYGSFIMHLSNYH